METVTVTLNNGDHVSVTGDSVTLFSAGYGSSVELSIQSLRRLANAAELISKREL
jgi:hypothetical protein